MKTAGPAALVALQFSISVANRAIVHILFPLKTVIIHLLNSCNHYITYPHQDQGNFPRFFASFGFFIFLSHLFLPDSFCGKHQQESIRGPPFSDGIKKMQMKIIVRVRIGKEEDG